jgi:hypothetical protein
MVGRMRAKVNRSTTRHSTVLQARRPGRDLGCIIRAGLPIQILGERPSRLLLVLPA